MDTKQHWNVQKAGKKRVLKPIEVEAAAAFFLSSTEILYDLV